MTLGDFVARFGALFGLTILVIFLSSASDVFLTPSNLSNIARQATVNALLAIGLLLAIITSGIDLSVGAVLALSMSTLALLAIEWGVNPYLAMLACLLVGAGMGAVNGLLLTRLHLPHPFIATLGTLNVARGMALMITGASPISGFDKAGADPVLWLGAGSFGPIPVALLVVLLVYVVTHIFLTRTTIGRHIFAVGGNITAARLSGIDVDRTLLTVYTLSGLMAGLAGLMLAGRTNSGYPTAALGAELDAISAVIIGGASFFGGVGTVWGTAIGVVLIAVLRNGLVLLKVPIEWQTVAIGAVIILAVWVDVLRQRGGQQS
ncbi:MAG: ABC transporter permease [Chloroflexales bacterium]|nr:ABC transporter permease [Chloroflexales bacterium]